jgi:hypothetical protein
MLHFCHVKGTQQRVVAVAGRRRAQEAGETRRVPAMFDAGEGTEGPFRIAGKA